MFRSVVVALVCVLLASCRRTSEPYLLKASELLAEGKRDQAIEYLTEAIRQDPKSAAALRLRGQLYLADRRYAAALEDFASAKSLAPQEFHDDLALAECYFQQRQPEAAIQACTEASDRNDRPAPAWVVRGRIRLERGDSGDYALAKADFGRALEAEPDYREARLFRAIVLLRQNLWEAAEQELTQFVEKHPRESYAYLLRAEARAKTNRLEQAESDRKLAVEINPVLGLSESTSIDGIVTGLIQRLRSDHSALGP